jgi:dTMP kinase
LSLFITFEGGEGCGKSTQAKDLWRRLCRLGIPTVLTCEPGGTTLGIKLRRLLKGKQQVKISPEAELLLFSASRIELVTEVICPNLQQGKVVICDRFADSSTVYQGYGRQIDLSIIKATNELATQGSKPDLTILLDIPSAKGLARKKTRRQDRFEAEEIDFHDRIRRGYLTLAAQEPVRWLVIDATLPRARIGKIVWNRVEQLIKAKNIFET